MENRGTWIRTKYIPRRDASRATPAAVSPNPRDLEWAAGFIEGEGCFHKERGSRWGGQLINCSQVNPEPLERLQQMFGGTIHRNQKHKRGLTSAYWVVYGCRARGVMMTLFPLMSGKRKQEIVEVLADGRPV